MNEILTPTLLVAGIGLLTILYQLCGFLDKTYHYLEAHKAEYQQTQSCWHVFVTAKYYIYIPVLLLMSGVLLSFFYKKNQNKVNIKRLKAEAVAHFDTAQVWSAPDPLSIQHENQADLIQYGRDLIARTSDYLGPEGIVKPLSNGMNCQNCHLEAGSKPFGNNYSAVAATYPKFRARSGTAETIYKRVNDCIQRSLNGQPLDTTNHEMKAIEAYIKWLGESVPKDKTPKGAGIFKIKPLYRATNPDSGQVVFMAKCQSCHGSDGQGLPMPEGNGRRYPPLWGDRSYNEAAGLFRLSMFAGYVKANMPFGASYQNPQLTDAEAWDLAAFVNSQSRPKHPFLTIDWPKISGKPYDHPFGPYADTFPEVQHKYGPFQPIIDWQKANQKTGK